MKKCNSCGQEFEDQFSFCPVDATPLNFLVAEVPGVPMHNDSDPYTELLTFKRTESNLHEYHPTILSSQSLPERLVLEMQFTLARLKTTWPDLKRDPIGFTKFALSQSASLLRECFRATALAGVLTAIFVMLSAVLLVTLNDRVDIGNQTATKETDTPLVEILTLPASDQSSAPSGAGVGTGSQGRVGFQRGKGEGSELKPGGARGGGSGGLKHQLETQQGKLPHPSEIPALIPQLPPARKQALPVAGMDIDPVLWKNMSFPSYGDPRSTSATPSNGPGNGGGMGNNTGTGIGDGRGDGFGPGLDGNTGGDKRELGSGKHGGGSGNNPDDPERVFNVAAVGQRARVLSKPEPQYTDEARRNQVTGTVVLRVIFSRSGDVTNIRAINSLPFGLTEKAIAAARQIRFSPATRGGQHVSVYMQLEYNFNLY